MTNKIAVVGDFHLGIAPNNQLKFEVLFESQSRFFTDCLLPKLASEGIDTIIFTGDLYDQRRRPDSKVSQYVEWLFQVLLKDYKCIILQGNHDTYYKDDLEVTALSNIWSKPNVTVISKITPMDIKGVKFLFVPWLTTALHETFVSNVSKISGKFQYAVGHFEAVGFPFEGGSICTDGLDPSILYNNFKHTISGHFHAQSYKEFNGSSIHFVGTPFPLTFADADETKGFFILDPTTNEREFVENTSSAKFVKIKGKADVQKYETLENCFVEFEYPESLSKEELYLIEADIKSKNPITFRSYIEIAKRSEDIKLDRTPEEIKMFEDMNMAIHSENIISMTTVFMEANPYPDPEMVFDILEDFRAKISG